MTDRYANRESYRSVVSGDGLRYFRVTVKETDLLVGVSGAPEPAKNDGADTPDSLEGLALQTTKQARGAVEREIAVRPAFASSLTPLAPRGNEHELVRCMLDAGRIAGTGPMAAVAGTVAAFVGTALHRHCADVVVENGGDLFLVGATPRTVAIAAGQSPFSLKLGIAVDPSRGVGVCTSSGTYGHSLSFGKSDAAVVVASSCALADAVATMLGNKCVTYADLGPAVEWAAALPGVAGAVAVMDDRLAAAGDIELVRLP